MSDRSQPPRLAWSTAETARMVGISADALRRRAERAARPAPGGGLIAELDVGIVGHKRGGRWHFVIPAHLLGDAAE